MFKTVPKPGFIFKKIQKKKTVKLMKNVTKPIDLSILRDIPWASTVHGAAPVVETINKPSPVPNKIKPKTRKKIVWNLGFKFWGFEELQDVFGTFFILKNIYPSVYN